MAGLKAARARGRKGGRKFALSKAQVRLASAARSPPPGGSTFDRRLDRDGKTAIDVLDGSGRRPNADGVSATCSPEHNITTPTPRHTASDHLGVGRSPA